MALILYVKNNITVKNLIIFLILLINSQYCFAKGKQYHTLQVTIGGLDNRLTEIIKNDLLIFQATTETKLTKDRIRNLHDKAKSEIINNLQSLGYYHATVTVNDLQEINNSQWLARYNINLGLPTKIELVDIQLHGEANNNSILTTKIINLSRKFLQIHQQLRHEDYEKTKQYILNKLHDYGFLNAQFSKSTVTINLKNYTASIVLIIDSKQQYYLGAVTFESDRYHNDFLQQYIPFKEHDVYSTKHLMQLKNNLLSSGLFAKVRIDAAALPINNNNIPITARVYAKPTNSYNASLGFGTDTGIRGNLGFTRKRLSHPGHQININLMGSKIRKEAIADYSLLGKDPTIDKYHLGTTAVEEHIQQRYNKNVSFYIQKTKKYDSRQQFWKLNFLTETFKELPTKEKQHVNFLLPSFRLIWTHHNNNISNNNNDNDDNETTANAYGNKLDIATKFASKIFASANLIQFNINEKWIQPLIYDLRLTCKGTIAITAIKNIEKLPLSLRFFAGGDYSVRGFAYESLGPTATDSAGNTKVIGGKHLILGSLELEKTIYKQISGAYFIDAGNALNTINNLNFNKLAVSTGLGLIYKTPVGSVRAYLAKPIQLPLQADHSLTKHLRFHFTFDAGL